MRLVSGINNIQSSDQQQQQKDSPSLKKIMGKGWPGGAVVKFTGSTLAARGSQAWIPVADLHTAHQALLRPRSTYKIEEDWHRC